MKLFSMIKYFFPKWRYLIWCGPNWELNYAGTSNSNIKSLNKAIHKKCRNIDLSIIVTYFIFNSIDHK